MAEKVIESKIKMTPEDKKIIENLDAQIIEAEQALDGLEAAGINVTALRNEISTARARREVLLKYF